MSGDAGAAFPQAFAALQAVWDDCLIGQVVIERTSTGDHDAIARMLEEEATFHFFPWLADGAEDLTLPVAGLREHDAGEALALFVVMAREAIHHGSPIHIDDDALAALFDAFMAMFSSPRFFVNFSPNAWRPMTGHTRDSLLVVIDTARVGLWFSCDDE